MVSLATLMRPELKIRGLRTWRESENMSTWTGYRGEWVCFIYDSYVEIRGSDDRPDPTIIVNAADPDFLKKVFEELAKLGYTDNSSTLLR